MHLPRSLNVIFLPSWYPVKGSPLNGIFNQELAELVSEVHNVWLFHIGFGNVLTPEKTVSKINDRFTEVVVILPEKGSQLVKQWRYFSAFFKCIKDYRKTILPDLIHVQVAWKMGLLAWLAKWRYGYPYVVTEHYTGYLPEDGELKGWKKWLCILILRGAKRVTAVSPNLENVLRANHVKRIKTIQNRVHDIFLKSTVPEHPSSDKFRYLHISNFNDRQKQTSVIIDCFLKLHAANSATELVLVVPAEKMQEYLDEKKMEKLPGVTHVQPGLNRNDYCKLMFESHILISYSLFETFGLTIAEAICCGLPVIYTQCGGPESFVEPRMGIVVDKHDDDSLLNAMKSVLNEYPFNRQDISRVARDIFDKEKILLEYSTIYQNMVK